MGHSFNHRDRSHNILGIRLCMESCETRIIGYRVHTQRCKSLDVLIYLTYLQGKGRCR